MSDYICLNAKNFDIEENKDVILVDKQLAKVISILNKKGYYTEMCSRARITKLFLIGAIIHDLIEEKLLEVNENIRDKIKRVIKDSDYESTLIIFKDAYSFDTLPLGYKLIGRDLIYTLSPLKDDEELVIKSLVELDYEHNKSLQLLEEWADKLPNNKLD